MCRVFAGAGRFNRLLTELLSAEGPTLKVEHAQAIAIDIGRIKPLRTYIFILFFREL